MKNLIALSVALFFASSGLASPLTSASVSGGGVATAINVDGDPAFISVLVLSDDAVVVDLEHGSAAQNENVDIAFQYVNNTGMQYDALELALEPENEASFVSSPVLSFGGVFESAVRAGNPSEATLTTTVFSGVPTFFDISIDIPATARLTITPLVPEPGAGLIALGSVLWIRGRRG